MGDMREIVQDAFVQYSGAVLQSRALVDVRDCIKPSARQIFYCMYTDGFLPNKPFKKTLKAVGSAFRTYIHGDASCVGVIMRSSQDFCMRYPLVEVEGSNGNLTEAGNWASPRYCLTGDTLVNTSKGLIRLDSIVESEENSDNKLNETIYFKGFNKTTSSDLIFNSGKQECIKLTLKNGIEISGTENHPLLVLDSNLDFIWKTIGELQVGDKVLVNVGYNYVYPENTEYNNLDMATALGCLVSEGCLTTENKIDMINSDLDMIYPVEKILKEYGSNATIRLRNQVDQCYSLTTTNIKLYNILKDYECCYNSYNKRVPTYILEGTRECQKVFLKYLFEGDGSVSIRNNTYGGISYSSVSLQLIKELQILLASNFGIMSSITKQKNRKEIKLEIYGEDLYYFYKEIGFVSERKNNILKQAAEYYESRMSKKSTGSGGWHIYPEIKEYLNRNYNDLKLIVHRNGRADECKGPLMSKAGLPILKEKLSFADYNKIENLYYNYCYVEITSKEDVGLQVVYSPKINEPTNEYTSNGLISHNTASRLSQFSTSLFSDIDKDTIKEWRDNYDDTEQYPTILPSKGYYNIVNGSMGIGVAIASSIPQFNLRDVNKAMETLLLNPDCDFNDIYCPVDFATGGLLLNEEEVKESLRNGSGKACKLRSVVDWNEKERCLVVTEIPFGVYTNTICGQLEEILNSEDTHGIERFNDLTGEKPLIKIYLTKKASPSRVLKYLFANTSLQTHYGINLMMLDKGRYPKLFTWKEALAAHITHEKEVYRRGYEYDMTKIRKRLHILQGLLVSVENIDDVISIIRNAPSTQQAATQLMNSYSLDEEQVKAVLAIRLSSLAKLEVDKLLDEQSTLQDKAKTITNILENENELNQQLVNGWRECAKKYGDNHRTKIYNIQEQEQSEKEEPPINYIVHLISDNSLYVEEEGELLLSRRNSRGQKLKLDKNLHIIDCVKCNESQSLLFITSSGRVVKIAANDLSVGYNDVGKFCGTDSFQKMLCPDTILDKHIVFVTKNGMVVKNDIEEYKGTNRGGAKAVKLRDDDTIVSVFTCTNEEIGILTKKGYMEIFPSTSLTSIGRNSIGVVGIKLGEGDCVSSAHSILHQATHILCVSGNGHCVKVPRELVRVTARGCKGVLMQKLIGDVNMDFACTIDKNNAIFVTNNGKVKVKVADFGEIGKNKKGNRSVKLKDGEVVIKILVE